MVDEYLTRVVNRLDELLTVRATDIALYQAYYDGHHRLAYAGEKWRTTFGGLFNHLADNWCQLVVDAVEERLDVEGFRVGKATEGDADAWAIWQDNNFDAESEVVHTEALINGISYVSVWGTDDGAPTLAAESPLQVITYVDAGDPNTTLVALKAWKDNPLEAQPGETTTAFFNVYTPERVYKLKRAPGGTLTERSASVPNPFGVVPIVGFHNKPRLLRAGISEIASVLPLQDACNKLLADLLMASEFGAFRQRWAVGIDVPIDPVTKQPIEPFRAAVDRLWVATDHEAKFGEFGQTDLTPYARAIELVVQHIASQTRTPPHYFYLSGQFPSGESIKAAETGLVSKAKRKARHFGDAWEDVIRLAFAVADDPRATEGSIETIWGDPESRSESELADACIKRSSLQVPYEQLWEDLGYSQVQISRFRSMRTREAMLGLTQPVATPATTPATAPPPAPVAVA